jgi:hypothetical protein
MATHSPRACAPHHEETPPAPAKKPVEVGRGSQRLGSHATESIDADPVALETIERRQWIERQDRAFVVHQRIGRLAELNRLASFRLTAVWTEVWVKRTAPAGAHAPGKLRLKPRRSPGDPWGVMQVTVAEEPLGLRFCPWRAVCRGRKNEKYNMEGRVEWKGFSVRRTLTVIGECLRIREMRPSAG